VPVGRVEAAALEVHAVAAGSREMAVVWVGESGPREPAAEQALRVESSVPLEQRDCQASEWAVAHRRSPPVTKKDRDKAVDYRL